MNSEDVTLNLVAARLETLLARLETAVRTLQGALRLKEWEDTRPDAWRCAACGEVRGASEGWPCPTCGERAMTSRRWEEQELRTRR